MDETNPAQGGSYIVENGVRRRVEDPTQDHAEGNCAREADGRPVGAPPEPQPARPARAKRGDGQ